MHHLNTIDELEEEGIDFQNVFARDVFHGLSHDPRWLSSKYFYDANGDKIFQKIMAMEEYYLTRSETEIFNEYKDNILRDIYHSRPFDLIELGAGDGAKTKILLKHFSEQKADFNYAPCDISSNAIEMLKKNVLQEVPDLNIEPLIGDYFEVLADKALPNDERKSVILFLGSNIGNYTLEHGKDFLKKLRSNIKKGDILILGFDLKKDPNTVLKAYNDPHGITRDFNLNILTRINRELGGEFDLDQFQHHPVYDPITGECRSYLLSKVKQSVNIRDLDITFEFDSWEPIFTEISRKFSQIEMDNIAQETGYVPISGYTDKNVWFKDAIWRAI